LQEELNNKEKEIVQKITSSLGVSGIDTVEQLISYLKNPPNSEQKIDIKHIIKIEKNTESPISLPALSNPLKEELNKNEINSYENLVSFKNTLINQKINDLISSKNKAKISLFSGLTIGLLTIGLLAAKIKKGRVLIKKSRGGMKKMKTEIKEMNEKIELLMKLISSKEIEQ